MLQLSKFWVSSLGILGIALFIFYFESLPSSSSSSLFSMDSSDSSSSPSSIYDFTVKDIKGKDVSLGEYKGKVLLIVNVASKCGLTHANYKELNLLYQNYKDQGLEILAFPCNQFAGQEPGTNDQIEESACTIFKAEFPIFDKKGGFLGDAIKWNFTKFLVNKDGKVVARYAPTTSPLKIEKDIQNLLGVAATASA
ncbi:Probable glutathione peroxidase 2 [Linum perenne]